MDRNFGRAFLARPFFIVALRKESVDRNIARGQLPTPEPVALRKESVDRNAEILQVCPMMSVSLSARRAWIEIV